jgi:hypothetical protein
MTDPRFRGSCLCGACRYEVHGPLRNVIACHCTQCRKQTGHYLAATNARLADFRLLRSDSLRWYRASARAQRGFCATCGSTLFWQADGRETISIAAGSLDGPTGLTTEGHIFCADRGDYYTIPDEGYRLEQWS